MSKTPTTQTDCYACAYALRSHQHTCGHDAPVVTYSERVAREFAVEYPTANVLRAVAEAERGRITWDQACALFDRALSNALESIGPVKW